MELRTYKDERNEYTFYCPGNIRICEVMHGRHKRWYDNGQLEKDWNYKHGEFHGHFREWERDGQLEGDTYWWEGEQCYSKEDFEEREEQFKILNKGW